MTFFLRTLNLSYTASCNATTSGSTFCADCSVRRGLSSELMAVAVRFKGEKRHARQVGYVGLWEVNLCCMSEIMCIRVGGKSVSQFVDSRVYTLNGTGATMYNR